MNIIYIHIQYIYIYIERERGRDMYMHTYTRMLCYHIMNINIRHIAVRGHVRPIFTIITLLLPIFHYYYTYAMLLLIYAISQSVDMYDLEWNGDWNGMEWNGMEWNIAAKGLKYYI